MTVGTPKSLRSWIARASRERNAQTVTSDEPQGPPKEPETTAGPTRPVAASSATASKASRIQKLAPPLGPRMRMPYTLAAGAAPKVVPAAVAATCVPCVSMSLFSLDDARGRSFQPHAGLLRHERPRRCAKSATFSTSRSKGPSKAGCVESRPVSSTKTLTPSPVTARITSPSTAPLMRSRFHGRPSGCERSYQKSPARPAGRRSSASSVTGCTGAS
mmetsp:Transcript_13985/g.41668  ORF Transcript_13985/g.41668 Transcript_13985/m.41668 type:complete len:217 (+) Transcript_13985:773-1423(+)